MTADRPPQEVAPHVGPGRIGYGGYRRSETEAQRIDRNFAELLQEVRVAQAGVQILFGFLLSLAFQARFVTLSEFQRDVYLVTLLASALAVICFTGPAAAHRLLFRRGLKDFLVVYTGRLAIAGLLFLALAVIGGVVLVVDVLLETGPAVGCGVALTLIGMLLWLGFPLAERGRAAPPPRHSER